MSTFSSWRVNLWVPLVLQLKLSVLARRLLGSPMGSYFRDPANWGAFFRIMCFRFCFIKPVSLMAPPDKVILMSLSSPPQVWAVKDGWVFRHFFKWAWTFPSTECYLIFMYYSNSYVSCVELNIHVMSLERWFLQPSLLTQYSTCTELSFCSSSLHFVLVTVVEVPPKEAIFRNEFFMFIN